MFCSERCIQFLVILAGAVSVLAQSTTTTVRSSSATSAAAPAPSVTIKGSTGGPEINFPANVVAKGVERVFTWDVNYVNGITRYNSTRRMIGVNGKWPIEPITINYNDTFVLNVKNSLDKPTGIHFHGMYHYGSPDQDGAPGCSQCPIPPGGEYTYRFKALQWGTYWIHGHMKGEYVDGLRTPFVINPPPNIPQEKHDNEALVSISDWYPKEHHVLLEWFLGMYNPSGAEPVPETGLINEVDSASFKMTPGKTTRFRVLSFAALVSYNIYIEGHDFYVVEVDGIDVEPSLQSSFLIAPAQRVSLIVKAREQGNGTDVNYNLHAVMNDGMFENPPANIMKDITMALVYNEAEDAKMFEVKESDAPNFDLGMDDNTLVPTMPLAPLDTPAPEHTFLMKVSFDVYNDGTNHGTFNFIPFMMPAVPALYSAVSVGAEFVNKNATYGRATQAMVVDKFDVPFEIIIVNTDAGIHPFHLHGHAFQIIANTNATFDEENMANNYPNPMPENPVRRDVVNIPPSGFAILRVQGNNPGAWFLHCHIEWHFEAGLAAILMESPSKIFEFYKGPDAQMQKLCKQQGISITGNGAGNKGLDMTGYMASPSLLYDGIPGSGWGAIVACALSSFIGVATVIWFAKKDEVKGEKGETVPAQ
ncbi:ferroxidase fet3 [Chytriomyces hyalinus]|nr:ferroxidase fet3 [Chytriomyces hyalinus]